MTSRGDPINRSPCEPSVLLSISSGETYRAYRTLATIMAMTTLPLATVRDRLSSLVDDVARTHDTLTITRNGTPAAVVLSIEDYESIMETLALLNDPVDQERLTEAAESLRTGEVTSGDEMGELLAQRMRRDA
jgi:antitoxin YefM